MGNIRTHDIKTASWEFAEKYSDELTEDFETNKEFIKSKNLIDNKLMRNKVAGYLVRIVKQKKKKEI